MAGGSRGRSDWALPGSVFRDGGGGRAPGDGSCPIARAPLREPAAADDVRAMYDGLDQFF